MTAHSDSNKVKEFDGALTVSKYASGDEFEKAVAYNDLETMCLQDLLFYPIADDVMKGYDLSEEEREKAITQVREMDGTQYLKNSTGYAYKVKEICDKIIEERETEN